MKRPSSADAVARLHPALCAWFAARFPAPTEVQRRALPHTLAGRNTLILAPTGSGKTLAAFLSVALRNWDARAAAGTLPNAVCAVYVSPLKSLDRDIHRNLEAPLEAINASLPEEARIRMEVRTGDTESKQRARQMRRRPHLLLTTPESLSRPAVAARLRWTASIRSRSSSTRSTPSPKASAARCSPSPSSAWRPRRRIPCSVSACPPPPGPSKRSPACSAARGRARSSPPTSASRTASTSRCRRPTLASRRAGYNPYRIASTVAGLVERAQCSLVFLATRSGAERMALALKILLPDLDEQIAVHHSSIELSERLAIEEGLAKGTLPRRRRLHQPRTRRRFPGG